MMDFKFALHANHYADIAHENETHHRSDMF